MSELDVIVQEVGPRDGLQIEPAWVETGDKIGLVEAIAAAGVRRVEVTSFVSPKAVPSLRDASEVFAGIERRPGTIYTALVPNPFGAERAIAAGADELNFVMSVSETHNLANVGATCATSLDRLATISGLARQACIPVNATVATAFGCPFEGDQPIGRLLDIVRRMVDIGATGITLADTTGMANPVQVAGWVETTLAFLPASALTLHFHNTRGLGLLNVDAAFRAGARRFDASLGGLGGCPFAPSATGNVCTEDLVNFFHEIGVATGVDLPALLAASGRLPSLIGHETAGQVVKAGLVTNLHKAPALPP